MLVPMWQGEARKAPHAAAMLPMGSGPHHRPFVPALQVSLTALASKLWTLCDAHLSPVLQPRHAEWLPQGVQLARGALGSLRSW